MLLVLRIPFLKQDPKVKVNKSSELFGPVETTVRPGFHYTTNATTTTQKQSDYKVEQSSFTLIALF